MWRMIFSVSFAAVVSLIYIRKNKSSALMPVLYLAMIMHAAYPSILRCDWLWHRAMFSLPSCDWFWHRVYALFPRVIGSGTGYICSLPPPSSGVPLSNTINSDRFGLIWIDLDYLD
eukprot:726470-Prorocentrum_minimum.AAC.1